MKMSLHTYYSGMLKRIYDFKNFWRENYEKNPEQFPIVLLHGDWDEHFQIFCEEENKRVEEILKT